jgi:hypothetical protein
MSKLNATLLLSALALGISGCGDSRGLGMEKIFGHVFGSPTAQGTAFTPSAAQRSVLATGDTNKGILRVSIPAYNARADLTLLTTRGSLQDWRATDGSSIVLSDGVLVGTRGLGADLFSAAAPGLVQALKSGRGTLKRQHLYLDGEGATVRIVFRCSVSFGEDSHARVTATPARGEGRIVESCLSERPQAVEFTNVYWFTAESKKIRQSRQWVSTTVGSIDIVNLGSD